MTGLNFRGLWKKQCSYIKRIYHVISFRRPTVSDHESDTWAKHKHMAIQCVYVLLAYFFALWWCVYVTTMQKVNCATTLAMLKLGIYLANKLTWIIEKGPYSEVNVLTAETGSHDSVLVVFMLWLHLSNYASPVWENVLALWEHFKVPH